MSGVDFLQRMRSAGLRATKARISVMEAVVEHPQQRFSTDQILRLLADRGIHISIGTIYQTVGHLVKCGLLQREWDSDRKSAFRLKHAHSDPASIRLVCGATGQAVEIEDAPLRARLIKLAQRQGLNSTHLEVHLDGAALAVARTAKSLPKRKPN